ncbi:MAG: sugar ABC transporter substrate-binding protein [Eubacteriales bacterium]|jgi:multiple sugar transport system substrate-binding protein|nr:sugar ABC transporter substrate-binding protein [Eubacteriales bacterium]MDD4105173.1 sugar ABC transporter substrate-binding protein [Eubacteriales bacterium]MDD4710770.1 sugar ABC transporter substrate-binding protein [Eubacteriales bacterium]NLO14776.1 sugar ABC transporter substrate-binding protein [Clostridiales bacterium]
MKKFLALFLSAVMVLTVGVAAAAQGDDRVHITYSYWGTPDEATSTQAVLDAYNASQDKVFVELMSIPNEQYTTKLQTMAAAGTMPDCGIMNENGVLAFANAGLLADVSDMYANKDSQPLDCVTFKNEGVTPVAYSGCNEILIMYYNKDMFDAAGQPYPPSKIEDAWSWDEFVQVAKKLTIDKDGKHPGEDGFDADNIVQYGCVVDNWTWQLEVWAHSNGGRWFSPDGKECLINSPEAIEAVQKVADLTLVEHVQPLYLGLADEGIIRSVASGTVAMATGGAWNMGTSMSSSGINFGIGVLPYMKEKVTIATSGPQVVFSQSKHLAEAKDFIAWYTQEENSWNLIETGIWMPLLEKYYQNDADIDTWLKDEDFPVKDYDMARSVLVDYTNEAAISTCWYYTPNTNQFIELLRSVLSPVWIGEQTAEQAITDNFGDLSVAIEDF